MLLLLILSCYRREPYYPPVDTDTTADTEDVDTDTPPDTDTSTDTADTDRNVWDDPEWWTEPGPFAPLMDLSNAPTSPHWEAWITTSKDMVNWTEGVPFAFNISSLDVLVLEDQGVLLTVSLTPNPELGVKAPMENLFLFHTTDLVNWGTHMIEIKDASLPMIIDPSIHRTPDGRLRMVFFGSGTDVDPKKLPDDYPNPHAIFEAWWDGTNFVQESDEPMLEADYVVDPSGCYDGDRLYMMGTRRYGSLYFVHRDSEDEPFEETANWGGVQVPFCYDQGEEPIFIAQYGGGQGMPSMRVFDERGDLGEAEYIFTTEQVGYGDCTTPVMGLYQDTYFLICASWSQ